MQLLPQQTQQYDPTFSNQLKQYLTQPGSYTASPGYQFALDQATNQAQRGLSQSGMRDSGNALAELTKLGAGYASQDYGSTIDRLQAATNSAQSYDLGLGQNANAASRNANDLALGNEQNRLTGVRDQNQYSLGQDQNANTAQRNANDFGLGMYSATNQYNLGAQSNANTAQNNWYNYDLGNNRNNIDSANNQNNFNLGQGRNAIDWYNAGTSRGQAQSNAYTNDQANQRAWYSVYPRQRIAGQP